MLETGHHQCYPLLFCHGHPNLSATIRISYPLNGKYQGLAASTLRQPPQLSCRGAKSTWLWDF